MKVALATGFPARVRTALLDHLEWNNLIDLSLGPENGRSRPAPDLVLSAVLQLKVDSVREVVVVGDTTNDLLCGARAGAGLICGVLTGAHRRADLVQVEHDLLLDSIKDLPAQIAR
jgi:phosphoglycolate phosphatase